MVHINSIEKVYAFGFILNAPFYVLIYQNNDVKKLSSKFLSTKIDLNSDFGSQIQSKSKTRLSRVLCNIQNWVVYPLIWRLCLGGILVNLAFLFNLNEIYV